MRQFWIITLCLTIGISATAQDRLKTTHDIKAASEKIDGVYIPRDIEDAIKVLDTCLTSEQKDTLRALSFEDYNGLHHGLGRALRNDWGLWGGSRLRDYFTSFGVYHPDDMSGYILLAFYHHLHGTECPRIQDVKLSTGSAKKITIFTRDWWRIKASYRRVFRELKDDGYKKGAEVYYEYPYGFSNEKEENIYNDAENLEIKARGVIKAFDKKNGYVLVQIEHTPEPYGIIIYDGNQPWYEDSYRDYTTFSLDTPNIFFLQEGDELWFKFSEFDTYWY